MGIIGFRNGINRDLGGVEIMIIGRLTKKTEDGEVFNWVAKIIPNGDLFDVKLYREYDTGKLSDDVLGNVWASTVASAKRRICQDSDWKSKDFKWEVAE